MQIPAAAADATGVSTWRPLYLAGTGQPMFAAWHPTPASSPPPRAAVLLVPPFGWEDMCSYRARRSWAFELAAAGHPTLRIDLPGTGDSGGSPRDPDRLEAWTAGVAEAAGWLAQECPGARVVAFGIGLGGLVAHRAAAIGAPIDDLVAWAVPARGRAFVRELRAFASMEEGNEQTPDGSLVAGGYVLTAATLAELEGLDLTALPLPAGAGRRALVLDRDARPADARLVASLEAAGVDVTTAPGDGHAQMLMVEPQVSRPADSVLATLLSWLAAAPAAPPLRAAPSAAATDADSAELTHDGVALRETPILLEHPLGNPMGVITEPLGPTAGFCVVWLNAGPQRRTGPNRMWVESARRWAARGVPVLRLDLAGIGDADGDGTGYRDPRRFYRPEFDPQVTLALDTLVARGLPGRFVLGGLCVGAYWSLQVALEDPRVPTTLMLNPGALVFDGGWTDSVRQTRTIAQKLLWAETYRRIARRETAFAIHVRSLWRLTSRLPARLLARVLQRDQPDPVEGLVARLDATGTRALVVFAGREELLDELRASAGLEVLQRSPSVDLRLVEVPHLTHTLRPLGLQRHVHQLVDESLAREVTASAQPSALRA